MRRTAILVLAVLLAGCYQPDSPTLPGGIDVVKQTSPTSSAEARLARYDGKQMRARIFTQRNGPRRLIATKALHFEKVGNQLRLLSRYDQSKKIWVGDGVELAFNVGHQEEYPPCEVGVPLEEQEVQPCTVPWCDQVNNVEPCQEVGQGEGGGGGGGGGEAFHAAAILSDTAVINTLANQFTSVATYPPVTNDSIEPDSLRIMIGDSLGSRYAWATDHDGRVMATLIFTDGLATSQLFEFDGAALIGVTTLVMTALGDTVSLEFTEELLPAQLRSDAAELRASYLTEAIFDEFAPDTISCASLKGATFRKGVDALGDYWEAVWEAEKNGTGINESLVAGRTVERVVTVGTKVKGTKGLAEKMFTLVNEGIESIENTIEDVFKNIYIVPVYKAAKFYITAAGFASLVGQLFSCWGSS